MKIPTTVVTGFLGAGKTTLVRHVLENADGKRIALIVNEFGDLGIDRSILRGCGIEDRGDDNMIELANGCICCAVADDFLPAMETLIDRDALPITSLSRPRPGPAEAAGQGAQLAGDPIQGHRGRRVDRHRCPRRRGRSLRRRSRGPGNRGRRTRI